jgi:hypothetical protein
LNAATNRPREVTFGGRLVFQSSQAKSEVTSAFRLIQTNVERADSMNAKSPLIISANAHWIT